MNQFDSRIVSIAEPRLEMAPASSSLPQLNFRVEAFQFDPGVGSRELPVYADLTRVAILLPCRGACGDLRLGCNTISEALASHYAQFGFGHVQPTAVFGSEHKLDSTQDAKRFFSCKRGVSRTGAVSI